MPGDSAFTLGDLLAQEELALELCAGGADALARRVAGAHSIEIEQPSSWLAPEWIMLTAGTRLRGSAEAQRALIVELDEAGVTALGIGLELVFKKLPAALAEEAGARGFPVFAVPLRTPFREITSAINRALLSSDLRTYQRVASMQLYLVDALREADPRATVVARLGELLDASVLVLSRAGAVELHAGDAPAGDLWAAIDARPIALHELDVDGWHAVATPVLAAGEDVPAEWLVVASRRSAFAHGLTKPVAQAAAPLLAATARLTATERTQTRAIRAAVLDDLLAGTGEVHQLEARAATFGIDLAAPARVLCVRGATADAVRLALERARAPHLVSAFADGVVVALAQGADAAVRAHVDALLDATPAAAAGVGRPVTDVAGVRHSLRDAQLALQRIGFHGERPLLAFEDFELGLLLISEAPPERIQPKVEAWTALLKARPMLWEAVLAYFDHDLDVARTAQALHLHPNSLRYRLARVEKLLGRSLKQPSTIAGLYIAILASPEG